MLSRLFLVDQMARVLVLEIYEHPTIAYHTSSSHLQILMPRTPDQTVAVLHRVSGLTTTRRREELCPHLRAVGGTERADLNY
ncbi:hypothetical protein AOLI_G00243880 [Acnodon oligacanthus]